ncbi:hypothetical protein [Nonomuraea sp. NPDC049784]|uniref:hypothetical protein n=1 Tax=Nonomuraea sp. NPDC049784 TaxID=3154361 RepID=UPI0033F7EBB8
MTMFYDAQIIVSPPLPDEAPRNPCLLFVLRSDDTTEVVPDGDGYVWPYVADIRRLAESNPDHTFTYRKLVDDELVEVSSVDELSRRRPKSAT